MSRLRKDDLGQITTALVMVGTVMVCALAVFATQLGQATDQKSRAQSAADAAALAGAQQIAKDAPELALKALLPDVGGQHKPDQFDRLVGKDSASAFALRAGARLVSYYYDVDSDTVRATVISLDSLAGSSARATAEARVGVDLGECEPQTLPSPSESPAPSPTPGAGNPAGSPPLDAKSTVTCGGVEFPIVTDASGNSSIDLSEATISDLFTPALKS